MKVSNGKARWQGFHDALKSNGLTYDPGLVVEGDYRMESGYRGGNLLLSHRPDGVYVANYLMTVGLLKAAEEMGLRCPEDFGLVSFDDYPWLGIFHPRLTTVELPKYQLGSSGGTFVGSHCGEDGARSRSQVVAGVACERILRIQIAGGTGRGPRIRSSA